MYQIIPANFQNSDASMISHVITLVHRPLIGGFKYCILELNIPRFIHLNSITITV